MNTGAERVAGGAKNGGGFFHLFDWNKKKTRKKLFATISPGKLEFAFPFLSVQIDFIE